jgi:hypothetical protein
MVAVPVEAHRGHLVDGVAAAFFPDAVVAARDVQVAVIKYQGETRFLEALLFQA